MKGYHFWFIFDVVIYIALYPFTMLLSPSRGGYSLRWNSKLKSLLENPEPFNFYNDHWDLKIYRYKIWVAGFPFMYGFLRRYKNELVDSPLPMPWTALKMRYYQRKYNYIKKQEKFKRIYDEF